MKRKSLLIGLSLMLSIAVLSGCQDSNNSSEADNSKDPVVEDNENKDKDKNENNKEDKEDKGLEVSSYYPIRENVRYVYQGRGNEFAGYNSYASYTDENKAQYRVENDGTVLADIIEIKDGEVVKLLSQAETYYEEDLLREGVLNNLAEDDREVLLKEPIEEGNSWNLSDGSERTITDISASVSTPLGQYEAVEVTTQGLDQGKTVDYYVKDIGLVKTMFVSEDIEVTSSLKAIEEDAKLTQTIKFFYPDIDDERLHYKEEQVDFKTNDISRMILEKAYKNSLEDEESVVLTEKTKVNFLYLNNDGMVYLDLSKDFLTEMNAGAGYESKILESVAATFGNYYGVEKVVLTIDGGDYESGHIVLKDGDYVEYNIEDAVQK